MSAADGYLFPAALNHLKVFFEANNFPNIKQLTFTVATEGELFELYSGMKLFLTTTLLEQRPWSIALEHDEYGFMSFGFEMLGVKLKFVAGEKRPVYAYRYRPTRWHDE